MQTPILAPNGQQIVSQEQAMHIARLQMYHQTFLGLVPAVAAARLRERDRFLSGDDDGGAADTCEEIVNTADAIAILAMKRIGIDIRHAPSEPTAE